MLFLSLSISDIKDIPNEIRSYVIEIGSNSSKKKGLYTVLTTLLYYKYLHPAQDIRLHQERFQGGFSRRGYNAQSVTPNISFSGNGKKENSFSFDVSTAELREQILSIIKDKIASYNEEIEKINVEITAEQETLNRILQDEDITVSFKEKTFYKRIDSNVNNIYTNLFTSKNELYSGSEFVRISDSNLDPPMK